MVESILNAIKLMLGIIPEDTAFDQEILVHINSAFMTLNQIGIGPESVFSIQDNKATWQQFTSEINTYSLSKTYIYLTVRLLFDPPNTSFLIDSIKAQKEECLYRLLVQVPIPPEV